MSSPISQKSNSMRKRNRIASLPSDIIFQILLLLPPESLPDLKRVCKQWKNIISSTLFIETHLHGSNSGIIYQTLISEGSYKTHFVEIQEGGIMTRDIDTGWLGRVRASCNGLLLMECKLGLYIVNPITKRLVKLPPSDISDKYPLQFVAYGLGFNSETKEFKVVRLCEYKKKPFIGCAIMTVGSDSWREICGPFYGLTELKIPITANGVLYWAMGKEYFVSMDVSNERFFKIPFPNCRLDSYHMLEWGDTLSLASRVALDRIDMWELKDFHDGTWVKRLSIGVECLTNLGSLPFACRAPGVGQSLDRVFLLGNLKDREVILFEYNGIPGSGIYAYDFKNQITREFEDCIHLCALDTSSCPLHVSSLITWRPSYKLK